MAYGVMTTKIARALLLDLESQALDVLYSHGQVGIDSGENLGKLRAWFSHQYQKSTILADLDIAVISRSTNRLIALIEIEETSDNPKLLIGDALAPLLCDHITFQRDRHLLVGPWTTLIVLVKASVFLQNRIAFLENQVNQLKSALSTRNATMRSVVMDSFQNEVELEEKLSKHIQVAIMNSIQATQA